MDDQPTNRPPLPPLPDGLEERFRMIVDLLPTLRPPCRAAAVHAVRHLRRAWMLREIDPEMAVFRAITAEEEASTALMRSLRRIGYTGAERLNVRTHRHKAGIWPMLIAVNNSLARAAPAFRLTYGPVGEGLEARLALTIVFMDGNGEPLRLPNGEIFAGSPVLPLDITEDVNGAVYTYADEIRDVAEHAGRKSIAEHVAARANLRNRLLYADDKGYPTIGEGAVPMLEIFSKSTRVILLVLLLVDPFDVPQRFAQQVLDAYLRIVRPGVPLATEVAPGA